MSRQPEWLSLDGGEEIVWTGRPRTWSIARPVARAVARTVVLVGAAVAVMGGHLAALSPVVASVVEGGLPGWFAPTVAAGALLWGTAEVSWAYLTIANVDYVLTDRNLYKKTGVASEHVTRVGLDRVQRTSQSKDLFGKLFDYGSVAVSTAGSSGVAVVVGDLDDPDELRTELRRLVNATGPGGTIGGRRGRAEGAEGATLRAVVDEARRLRETATAVEEVLEG